MQEITHLVDAYENEFKKTSGTTKSESLSDKDAGFCSGEETDLDTEYHSPIETSRDSSDSKEYTERTVHCQKRKCSEFKLLPIDEPEVKFIKIESGQTRSPSLEGGESVKITSISSHVSGENSGEIKRCSPFRPWSANDLKTTVSYQYPHPSQSQPLHENYIQEEPLSLVVVKREPDQTEEQTNQLGHDVRKSTSGTTTETLNTPVQQRPYQELALSSECQMTMKHEPFNNCTSPSSTLSSEGKAKSSQYAGSKSSHRNYKNMTRERRIEANARERTRVHTISAAFDNLRKCIPAYASNQKLSKLSVLRIACSYILTLSRIAGYDYTADQSEPCLSECVGNVSNTIQSEGKSRRRETE